MDTEILRIILKTAENITQNPGLRSLRSSDFADFGGANPERAVNNQMVI